MTFSPSLSARLERLDLREKELHVLIRVFVYSRKPKFSPQPLELRHFVAKFSTYLKSGYHQKFRETRKEEKGRAPNLSKLVDVEYLPKFVGAK